MKTLIESEQSPDSLSNLIIGNPQMGAEFPIVLPDNTTFYGLYPFRNKAYGIPSRIFSADGETVYLSVHQASELKLLAVDLNKMQITFHPQSGIELIDVYQDVMLTRISKLNTTSAMFIAGLNERHLIPTTTTTTTTTTAETTKLDACLHLLQRMEIANKDYEAVTVIDNTAPTSLPVEIPDTTTAASTTTMGPPHIPLPIIRVNFNRLTAQNVLPVHTEHLLFEQNRILRQSEISQGQLEFNAIYAAPIGVGNLTLLVYLKPFDMIATDVYSKLGHFVLEQREVAVLIINYRGTGGMGDKNLEDISGYLGEVIE